MAKLLASTEFPGLHFRAGWAFFAALLGVGCGQAAPTNEGVGSAEGALDAAIWQAWSSSFLPSNSGGFADASAVCRADAQSSTAAAQGFMVLGRHAGTPGKDRYRLFMYYKQRPSLSWTEQGTTTFNSKPACTPLGEIEVQANDSTWSNQMVFVGKRSSDNLYCVRIVTLSPAGQINVDPPPVPTVPFGLDWHPITTSTYLALGSSQAQSFPSGSSNASAAFTASDNGYLVVGGRRSDNRIYLYVNGIYNGSAPPVYSKSNWLATAFQVPALPTGWTADGDPAVAADTGGAFLVTTRARNALNQSRLYVGYVFVPYLALGGWITGSWSGWTQPSTGTIAINSDPAIEYDYRLLAPTAYFRGTQGSSVNRIYQSTRNNDGTWPAFTSIQTDSFTTAPAVASGLHLDAAHMVIARKTDAQQLWQTGTLSGTGF